MFGDDVAARDSATSGGVTDGGGDDFFLNIGGSGTVVGDVLTLATAAGRFATYDAGGDSLIGRVTSIDQTFFGDARQVLSRSHLLGGDDTIQIASASAISIATGDAAFAGGAVLGLARITGGGDTITGVARSVAAENSKATLIGDVENLGSHALVSGGDDRIRGSDASEFISGDVGMDGSIAGARLDGGDDALTGNGGDDVIAGDLLVAYPLHLALKGAAVVTGGADTIRGGSGADRLFGELGTTDLAALTLVSGGNDQILGEAGDDFLFGQTGNDVLNGGAGRMSSRAAPAWTAPPMPMPLPA